MENRIVTIESVLKELKSMFSSIDEEIISEIFMQSSNNFENTVTTLLSMVSDIPQKNNEDQNKEISLFENIEEESNKDKKRNVKE